MISKITEIYEFDVWFMYVHEDMTQQEIADYYGVSQSTIYSILHPEKNEKKKEYSKQWRLDNPEYNKDYYQDHTKESIERAIKWQREHPEKANATGMKWHREHPGYKREWRQTKNGKAYVIRRHAERRELGSIELNIPFPDSEGHHIDETYIIHIPKELHRSIPHNLKTGQGMEEINAIAFRYITEETFDKLLAGEI